MNKGPRRLNSQPWAQTGTPGIACPPPTNFLLSSIQYRGLVPAPSPRPGQRHLRPGLLTGRPTSSRLPSRPLVTQLPRMTFASRSDLVTTPSTPSPLRTLPFHLKLTTHLTKVYKPAQPTSLALPELQPHWPTQTLSSAGLLSHKASWVVSPLPAALPRPSPPS